MPARTPPTCPRQVGRWATATSSGSTVGRVGWRRRRAAAAASARLDRRRDADRHWRWRRRGAPDGGVGHVTTAAASIAEAVGGGSRQGVPPVAAPPTVALVGAAPTMHVGGAGAGPLADAIPASRSGSSSSSGRGRSGGRHHHRGPRLVSDTAAAHVRGAAHRRRQVEANRAGATTPPSGAAPAATNTAVAGSAGAPGAARPTDGEVVFWAKRGWHASCWRTLTTVGRVATTGGWQPVVLGTVERHLPRQMATRPLMCPSRRPWRESSPAKDAPTAGTRGYKWPR